MSGNAVIKIRSDTTANWAAANPTLANKELAFDIDEQKFKVGDGATAWATLPFTTGGSGLGTVDSVNGQTGVVVLDKTDIGLSSVNNTSDANKPVSTATQTALNAKLDDTQAGAFGLTLLGSTNLAAAKTSLAFTKADVGLGNVDNTADSAKNVATAVSANTLTVARAINGVPFDGSSNITINAVDSTARLASSAVSAYGLSLVAAADAAAARATLGAQVAGSYATGGGTATGTNTGDQTTITGNAGSATVLQSARMINGVAFDGSTNITINAVDSTARLASSAVSAFMLTVLDDVDAPAVRTSLGLGTLATQSGAFSGTSSGTNTGDETKARVDTLLGATGGTTEFYRKDGTWAAPAGGGGGAGTVTSVSVVTANGVSGSVATGTTTPAITLTLGAITPTSVASVGAVTGSNLSGTNTGDEDKSTIDTKIGATGGTTYYRKDGTWATPSGGSSFRGALVKKSTDQVGANYTTLTTMTWDAEDYDTDSIHDNSTNNQRLVVPAGVSKVRLSGQVRFNGATVNNWVYLEIMKNGGGAVGGGISVNYVAATNPSLSVESAVQTVVPGDYFTIGAQVSTDTSMDVVAANSWFAMEIIETTSSAINVPDGDKGDIAVSGGGTAYTIDAGVVSFSKMANLAANSIIGNNTGSAATPLALTGANVTAMLSAVVAGGAQGVMTGADKTKLDGIATGATANTGTVTGVTGTAPIASTGGTAPVISIAAATTSFPGSMSAADKTKLDGVATGATANTGTVTGVTGTAPIVSSGGAAPAISINAATTSLPGSMSAADKTKLDGVATAATANSTDASLRDRATHTGFQASSTITIGATARFVGRITSGSGAAEELTGAQATSLLDAFSSSSKGLAPASGGGTTNYLRADGTWAAPAGGGGGAPYADGNYGDVTVSGTGTVLTVPALTNKASLDGATFTGNVNINIPGGAALNITGTGVGANASLNFLTDDHNGSIGGDSYYGFGLMNFVGSTFVDGYSGVELRVNETVIVDVAATGATINGDLTVTGSIIGGVSRGQVLAMASGAFSN